MYFVIEAGLTVAALVAAWVHPGLLSGAAEKVERALVSFAARRYLSVATVAAAALAMRLLALLVLPIIPHPLVHDEFGHLLIGDTFSHGRLTNPMHPLWVHFESFNILVHPTYQGFAQPGQGLFLALGQRLLGHPFWGVCISLALMAAAICWMLQAWVSPAWGLIGGLLVGIRIAAFSYWGNSYWGGAVAAAAGALILGALLRITRGNPRLRYTIAFCLGVLLLANTRPFEGLVFCVPVFVALLVWIKKRRPDERAAARRLLVLPSLLLLGTGFVWMGYYFWRVTGSPFRMPYQVHEAEYAVSPYFIWRSPHPQPVYHHEMMKVLYVDVELGKYEEMHSMIGLFRAWVERFGVNWFFYLGPLLSLPLLVAAPLIPVGTRWADLSSELKFLLILTAIYGLALASEIYSLPHYAAPLTCVFYTFVLLATRYARSWRYRGRPSGIFLSRALGMVCVLLLLMRLLAVPLRFPREFWWPPTWAGAVPDGPDRAPIKAQIDAVPGQHLVIVRYGLKHDVGFEWVYNDADIDGSKTVWARDMGDAANKELLSYYPKRDVWVAEPDANPPRLLPYRLSAGGNLTGDKAVP